MDIYRRPTTPKQLLRKKTATDGVPDRRSTSNTEMRLHVFLRPEAQFLRAENRSRTARLPKYNMRG
jgi:hypothetical protein